MENEATAQQTLNMFARCVLSIRQGERGEAVVHKRHLGLASPNFRGLELAILLNFTSAF